MFKDQIARDQIKDLMFILFDGTEWKPDTFLKYIGRYAGTSARAEVRGSIVKHINDKADKRIVDALSNKMDTLERKFDNALSKKDEEIQILTSHIINLKKEKEVLSKKLDALLDFLGINATYNPNPGPKVEIFYKENR